MKEKIKIKFVDFWTDFNKCDDNYFYELLSEKFDLQISDNPNILFYSCFGKEHLKYNCIRIFYSSENWRPNFNQCDYAISFDYLKTDRNLRTPIWLLYYLSYQRSGFIKQFENNAIEMYEEWKSRKNFCCMIVSNANATERIEFYNRLNRKSKVDSAGKWNNTIGRNIMPGTEKKFNFIKDYRFVISFENSSYSGYTTEKILEPMLAGSIPIYWGDPNVNLDFNCRRFVNVENREDYDEVINQIMDLENNKIKAKDKFAEPIFANKKFPPYLEKDYLVERLYKWVLESKEKNFKGVGNSIGEKLKYYSLLSKSGIKGFIRRSK